MLSSLCIIKNFFLDKTMYFLYIQKDLKLYIKASCSVVIEFVVFYVQNDMNIILSKLSKSSCLQEH